MKKSRKFTGYMMMAVTVLMAALLIQVGPVFAADDSQPKIMPTPAELGQDQSRFGEKFIEEFKAAISSNTIKVGQSAIVTLTGGQLDVAGGNSIDNIGTEFASIVEVVQTGKGQFEVKGIGPGNAVLKFTDGKNEVAVKIRVSEK